MHEHQQEFSRHKAPGNRNFGFTVGGIFLLLEVWRYWSSGDVDLFGMFLLGIGGVLVVAAGLVPRILTPFNRAWMRLGDVLFRFVNPVVMFLMYSVAIVPVALIVRFAGKDLLNLKRDDEAKTYWIERNPPGPEPDSMKNQF
ncbi:hypothetical protein [Thalassospira sp.]|uniref:hypothetical protein n=1 Tax=Thalassospira TaxID=168934 RepID=UPI0032EFAA0E